MLSAKRGVVLRKFVANSKSRVGNYSLGKLRL